MNTYYDLTRTNDLGDTMGLEAIFNEEGVMVRYYAKGRGNGQSHKTYYFDTTMSDELHSFIARETSGRYENVSCVEAMLLNFDHWLHSKQEFDHLQLKYAKDSSFDALKNNAETYRFEVAEEEKEDHYWTYFSKVS